MNCVYFQCQDHGQYIDAGYRWAYWQLEDPGVVTLGAAIDLPSMLNAEPYWNHREDDDLGEKDPGYLDELLPRVRRFLKDHSGHRLVYVDSEWLHQKWGLGYDYRELER